MIDVIIQTYNEERNLPHTLDSVMDWAHQVFIVDSGSTDATIDIARDRGATVVHHDWEGYARQKNWALRNLPLTSPWTLIIDADEGVSPDLRDEMLAIAKRPPEEVDCAGFLLNRIFIFMGKRIRHCGYFPSYNLRFFKRGMAEYEDRRVHEHMDCRGPVGKLKGLLIHNDRRDLEHFFAKHNRYSTLEAQEIVENPEQTSLLKALRTDDRTLRRYVKHKLMPRIPASWMVRFLYMYVWRMGFLDGKAGWWLCHFISNYEMAVQIKLRQYRREGFRQSAQDFSTGLAVAEGTREMSTDSAIERPYSYTTSIAQRQRTEAAAIDSASQRTLPKMPPEPPRPAHSASHAPDESEAAPTLIEARRPSRLSTARDHLKFVSPWSFKQNVARALWMLVSNVFFRFSFHNWYMWRRFLLRLFGAKIGRDVRVRPSARIEIPWNVEIGDGSVVGDDAKLYSLGKIRIGERTVVSQYAHLCAGTHDYHDRTFPLLRPPITIGNNVWVAADAFVAPNVTIGDHAVIGARSSVFKDIPANVVAAGNPARPLKRRLLEEGSNDVRTEPIEQTKPAEPTAADESVDSADDAVTSTEPQHVAS